MKFKKLTPDMMVDDVRKSVEFYTDVLGFKLNMAVPENSEAIENELEEDRDYEYAMVSRDEVYIMFMRKDAFAEHLPMLKGAEIGASVSFYCEVDNIDELYDSLKDKADIAIDPHTTWYGMREFYIKDCNGYILAFAGKNKNKSKNEYGQ